MSFQSPLSVDKMVRFQSMAVQCTAHQVLIVTEQNEAEARKKMR